MEELKVLGNDEWCVFEDLGIPAIRARVDSGARTSSLQAMNTKIVMRHGEEWVTFEVHPLQHNRSIAIPCSARLIDRRMVRGSTGISEERLVIRTRLTLGKDSFPIELTLASRDSMEYRMLLGREALSGRYLVDPAKSALQGDFSEDTLNDLYAPYMQQRTGLRIALLASNPNLYSNRRIQSSQFG